MLSQIALLLIETAFGLFIYVVLMRFWMQALRAPFRNPIGQFVMALTNWAVLPLRRVIPSFRSFDLATLLVAWLAQIAMMMLVYTVGAGSVPAPGLPVLILSILELLRASVHLLMFVVIIDVVLGWLNPGHPLGYVFQTMTRPFYRVFRSFIPPLGGFDLSPLFVLLLAQVLLIVLANAPRALLTLNAGV